MKKITSVRILAICILSFVVIFACSKDFEDIINDSFDFSFVETHDEDIFVFEASKTDFLLQPERKISTVSYFLKYKMLNGKGYYLNEENDTIRENDTILVKDLNVSFNYVAIDTGTHKVQVLAWDSNQLEKELELNYSPKFASFSFSLTKGTEELIINSKNPVNATLIRDKGTSENIENSTNKFRVSYQIKNGTGTLFAGNTAYEQGKEFILPKGVSELGYQPQTLGEHTLIMTAIAADGAILTKELVMSVGNLNFTFRATAGASQVELNTNLPINIDLQTQNEDSNVTYEITHSFSSGSQGAGTVRDQNGGVMNPGTNREIQPGNYNYTFKSEVLGQRKIYFDMKDSNGQVKRDSVEIEVANIPFTFTGNAESNQVFVNQRTQLNFNIKSSGNTSNIDYFVAYNIVEGNGRISGLNGNTIQNNTDYHIELGNFSLFYFPESLDNHKIEFSVTDNFGQSVGPVVIDLTARNLEIEFNASANNSDILVGQRGPINLSLIEKGDYAGVSYELSYFVTGGDGRLVNGNATLTPSQFSTVVPGSFSYDFIGSQPGTYEITFLLRDSNGQQLPEEKVTLVVGNNDFGIIMTPQKSTEFSNIPVNIIVDIEEIPAGTGDTYEAFFSSSKNGSILLNGASYGPGEKFPLTSGVNIISYTGLESGAHNLVLSVKSGSDVTRTSEAIITFNQVDFSFTGGAQKSTITVGENISLNFNISESIGNSNYTMRFSLIGSGIITDSNGTVVSAGNIYDVPKGNFNWSFEGTDESNVTMTFIARNETGLEKTVPISIDVNPKDFNFSASAPISQAFTGEPLDLNYNIEEIGIGGDTYTMSFSSGNNTGNLSYGGQVYAPGENFSVPIGAFQGVYTGTTEGNHNVVFTVRSSSNVSKQQPINLNYEVYVEPFTVNISQSTQDKFEGQPFQITTLTNATSGHEIDVTYEMSFTFSGTTAGYVIYKGVIYREGEIFTIDYGSTPMQFFPQTDENFTINFRVENSTGQSQTHSESIAMLRKPFAAVKGEKHNINCGGLNGCDYEVRIYTCWDVNCSEAYNGSTLSQVEIRMWNRKSNRWDTLLFNYNDARGSGVDRYFKLEEEPRESRLKYLDQRYEVRVRDTNGQWSEVQRGTVQRV